MLEKLHQKKGLQLGLALLFGFVFGFLLQKGGVCRYETIINQLLLKDFTVVKVMMTAVLTGMIGIYAMRAAGWVRLHKRKGSVGTSIPGPLIFGVGFGLLGYCPGTAIGAIGQGSIDALVGGLIGITIGAGLFAAAYPALQKRLLGFGDFGDRTLAELVGAKSPWIIIAPVALMIGGLLLLLERAGL